MQVRHRATSFIASLRPRLTRHSEGGALLEAMLVSAVSSLLAIRWFLALTGYPKIGGGGLHIAHMLWGGAFMLVALLLLVLYLDRGAQRVAAVLAGIGFGTFVDEIGKFLTADNDYFFRPAIALIYVIFVVLFLGLRMVLTSSRLTGRESLANALDLLEGAAGGQIDHETRLRILALLHDAGRDEALAAALEPYVRSLPDRRDTPSRLDRLRTRALRMYVSLAGNAWFERAVVAAVAVYAIGTVLEVATIAFGTAGTGASEPWTVSQAGQGISSVAGAILVLRGVPALAVSRVAAYHWFLRGLLVWLLVTQVFVFYASQLGGIAGLAVDLAAYATLRTMLGLERTTRASARVRPTTAPA